MSRQDQPAYVLPESPRLAELAARADALKTKIEELRPLEGNLWETIQFKLRAEWTYDSNAIEGSTLTKGETIFFLQEGLTVEGKPLKDFLDARNHAEAIDYLHEVIRMERPISEDLIKHVHFILFSGVHQLPAFTSNGREVRMPARAGEYKREPNYVYNPDGSLHSYVDPLDVADEMKRLTSWIEEMRGQAHPAAVGAMAHYNFVRIHPFADGNGRIARILMNLILMREGYPPAIIRNEQRRGYIAALRDADQGELAPFVEFCVESLVETEEMMAADLYRS